MEEIKIENIKKSDMNLKDKILSIEAEDNENNEYLLKFNKVKILKRLYYSIGDYLTLIKDKPYKQKYIP